ncbi:NlpC/P60 family protein [Hymenobacter sp. DH14]|uniref:NlpC/P60 family protein n=1 Tax=Hymenobacter cyanobacteriorum TaxID=2926463 RepID=A0A9X2AFB2_9BACT|nr:C40 family peptidase [Hymenobacter cyanobacteriorum]MCI1187687.1 NlpC/P60 family protein [Hymenobacter cyanobacteriorum]
MRYIWMIFGVLLVAMLAMLPRLGNRKPGPMPEKAPVQQVAYSPAALAPSAPANLARADSIVAFGLAQRGTPYVWAGTSPLTGFDCSGFIMYTFAHFGVPIPHSTALLVDVGRPVARAEAQPGDIVVFTGTAQTSTTPGHAGIVISRRGELPLRFVHASSSRREPFVKVSQVEDSDYERRFMQVRRVLGPGTGVVATARAKAPTVATVTAAARVASPVPAMPARTVAVEETAAPVTALPKVLPKLPVSRRVAARKPAAKTATTRKASTKPVAKAKTVAKTGAKAAKTRKATARPTAKVSTQAKSTPAKTATKKKKPATSR